MTRSAVPYTPEPRPRRAPSEELRSRIPGWGVDLDPQDRPSVPRLQPLADPPPGESRVRQAEKQPRERSIEHAMLTPVFGTSCPTHGLSGVVRRFAYRRFGEARAAHWLLLIAADRVDSTASFLMSLASGHPDNLIAETGVRAEFTHHGIRSRRGAGRADLAHLWMDPAIIASRALMFGGIVFVVARRRRASR